MEIYAIWRDNNESWEDHSAYIMQNEMYLSIIDAQLALNRLNKEEEFIIPSLEDYKTVSEEYFDGSYLEFIDKAKEYYDEDVKNSYSIITLQIK